MTSEQAGALLKLLTASYPQTSVSLESQAAYMRQLIDLDFQSVLAGVNRVIRESKFFPSIAEIRAAQQAGAMGAYMRRPQIEDRSHGPCTNAERREWADRLAAEAARLREVAHMTETYWSAYLDEVAKIYAENANRIDRGERLLPIPRVSELVKGLLGKPAKRVTQRITDAIMPEDTRP